MGWRTGSGGRASTVTLEWSSVVVVESISLAPSGDVTLLSLVL